MSGSERQTDRRRPRQTQPPTATSESPSNADHLIRFLHDTLGNQAVQQFLSAQDQSEVTTHHETITGCEILSRLPEGARLGRIGARWSAALRSTPRKDPDNPHANTIADLEAGTPVEAIGRSGNWLQVEVTQDDATLTGYVSCELVEQRLTTIDYGKGEDLTAVTIDEVADALPILKQAERAVEAGDFDPDVLQQGRIDQSIAIIEGTGRYEVDRDTYEVSFVDDQDVEILSIEDFILFVETIERAYPDADPQDIATEVRQLRHETYAWDLMIGNRGLHDEAGDELDMMREGPIAEQFDLESFEPGTADPVLATPHGTVDIAHVIAGIDALLSGSYDEYPEDLYDTVKPGLRWKYAGEPAYDALMDASGGEVRDFATWAGDLGQAYAEFLVKRWVEGDETATLKAFRSEKASEEKLRGDIHGFVAGEVWDTMVGDDPDGAPEQTVSNMLRAMYLQPPGSDEPRDPTTYFEAALETEIDSLKSHIRERVEAFAPSWFSNTVRHHRGNVRTGLRHGWSTSPFEAVIQGGIDEYEEYHKQNEDQAKDKNKLETLIDHFLDEFDLDDS